MDELSEEEKAEAMPEETEMLEENEASAVDVFFNETLKLINYYSGKVSPVEMVGVLEYAKNMIIKK